jgi:hypothetical protein
MECYNSRFSVICFEEVGQKPKNKSVWAGFQTRDITNKK